MLLPRDETVAALRANVGSLQRKLNNTRFHVDRVVATNRRLRDQLAHDREYLDGVKTAAWLLVSLVDRAAPRREVARAADLLRETLEGRR